MKNGFTFQECLELLENEFNKVAFQTIGEELKNGLDISQILPKYSPTIYKHYLQAFLKYTSFLNAMSLSHEIVSYEKKIKKDLYSKLSYPIVLLVGSVLGILIFSIFCFPPIIGLMESFNVNLTSFYHLRRFSFVISLIICSSLLSIAIGILYFFKENNKVKGYTLIYKLNKHSIIIQYQSILFTQFYISCYQSNISTKECLHVLSNLPYHPIISFISTNINESLQVGNTFNNAIKASYIDNRFERFIKIAMYGSNFESMLNGYLDYAFDRFNQKIKLITKIFQITSYTLIGFIIVMMYQILLLPMSMISNI